MKTAYYFALSWEWHSKAVADRFLFATGDTGTALASSFPHFFLPDHGKFFQDKKILKFQDIFPDITPRRQAEKVPCHKSHLRIQ